MSGLALSTMWAQQERFAGAAMAAFTEVARAAGFDAIEVSHSTDEAGLRACLERGALPVVSLHAPAPLTALRDGRLNSALNLAALDEDERQAAVAATCHTIEIAAGHGCRAVVVHLGHIVGGPGQADRRLRELFAAGAIDGDEAHGLRATGMAARQAAAPPYLEAARRSLAELVACAAGRVAIGLENRLGYSEIPSPSEALDLLAPYPPAVAGYWHDVGHAEVWARLGWVAHGEWFDRLQPRLIGTHLHDVRGITDHRAPGNGTVDWALIRAGLPATALRTCEIDQREPEASLATAVALLRADGLAGDAG